MTICEPHFTNCLTDIEFEVIQSIVCATLQRIIIILYLLIIIKISQFYLFEINLWKQIATLNEDISETSVKIGPQINWAK